MTTHISSMVAPGLRSMVVWGRFETLDQSEGESLAVKLQAPRRQVWKILWPFNGAKLAVLCFDQWTGF